jgi:hypothetical protein
MDQFFAIYTDPMRKPKSNAQTETKAKNENKNNKSAAQNVQETQLGTVTISKTNDNYTDSM